MKNILVAAERFLQELVRRYVKSIQFLVVMMMVVLEKDSINTSCAF
jgi:hypothetical protein